MILTTSDANNLHIFLDLVNGLGYDFQNNLETYVNLLNFPCFKCKTIIN